VRPGGPQCPPQVATRIGGLAGRANSSGQ